MSAVIERVGPEEYRISCGWSPVNAVCRALHDGRASALWGVGEAIGRAALFGRPTSFRGRDVDTFSLSPRAAIPYPREHNVSDVDAHDDESYLTVGLADIDPRILHASQWGLRHDALFHYLHRPYEATGELFDNSRDVCNDWPVVFGDVRSPLRMIWQGHHRSTAALIMGRSVRGRLVRGQLRAGVRR
ncbi:MAG: hypothetical protein WCP28_14195 [Actinomycetes bacterium]